MEEIVYTGPLSIAVQNVPRPRIEHPTEIILRLTSCAICGSDCYKQIIAQEPVGRMGKPEEIAAAVLWLCLDEAAFVTGDTWRIDGGQLAH